MQIDLMEAKVSQMRTGEARAAVRDLITKVRELQADRDCWAEQASQRVKDWDDMRQRAEAAEQRVRELEQENALLREVVAEYNDCIRYMDAGGDFHEFQRITIDAARGGKEHG